MFRFSARIARDPNGYEWRNLGKYGPEDGDERYGMSMFLQAKSIEEYCRRLEYEDDWLPPDHAYDPFVEEPALFRIFAAVEPTEDGILEFAIRYGDIAHIGKITEHDGEQLLWWRSAIEDMKKAVAFADSFRAPRRKGDPERDKAPHVMLDFINELLYDVPVFLQAVEQRGRTSLDTVVVCMRDVMKLQLATSIIEGKKYRNCEYCFKPFEVTPQINRSDRMFCSDNCRVKAYYRRKKQAVELRQKGQHLRDIVKKTGSDLETVKGWVKGVQTKEKK
jgi:hypothetical protein